jgi:hypothetical protein
MRWPPSWTTCHPRPGGQSVIDVKAADRFPDVLIRNGRTAAAPLPAILGSGWLATSTAGASSHLSGRVATRKVVADEEWIFDLSSGDLRRRRGVLTTYLTAWIR